jgi:hypothetical protein
LDSTGLTLFRESNLFHQCPTNFYQTQTLSFLSPALTTPLATSVSVAIIAQNNGHYICQTDLTWNGIHFKNKYKYTILKSTMISQ